mgnify:CR=1 FL=1
MASLTSFSALNEHVKLNLTGEDDKMGKAFMRLALSIILKINDEDIEDSITDGGMDGEIDAIYINQKTVHIFTFKYTDNFNLSKNTYPESELDVFTLTLQNLISGNLDKRTVNSFLWDKYLEVLGLINNCSVEFKIYVVSNKEQPNDRSKTKLEQILKRFGVKEPIQYYDQDRLVEALIDTNIKTLDGSVHFVDTQHFEKANGDLRTVIGVIPASDLLNLVKSQNESGEIEENAFNENVRVYKPNHRVNKAIIESAKEEDNYKFFYLNNGITIICEECDYKPNTKSPFVRLTNFQIINGGQTTHSLFKFEKENPGKIHSIELLMRICVAKKGNPIAELISETTNSQIPVGNRDLHSIDPIQRKLEKEFAALDYYYERKANQHSDKPKQKRLNNELLGQLYMSYYLDKPSEAKNSKTLVFGDLYDQIFDEDNITANKLLFLYNLYLPLFSIKKEIQNKKRKGISVNESKAYISRATFHILFVMKLIIEYRQRIIEDNEVEKNQRELMLQKLYSDDIPLIRNEAIKYIGHIIKLQKIEKENLYTHDKFFKELATNQIIKTFVTNDLPRKVF